MRAKMTCVGVLFALAIAACSKEPAIVTGIVLAAPGKTLDGITVVAESDGEEVESAEVDPNTGRFTLDLRKYDECSLKLTRGSKSHVIMEEVVPIQGESYEPDPFFVPDSFWVDEGGADSAAAEQLVEAQPEARPLNGVISGKCSPKGLTVRALSGDKIVAEGLANGSFFEVKAPTGTYDIEFSMPGYYKIVEHNVAISAGGPSRKLEPFLFYMSGLEAINWDRGVVTAVGTGEPNPNMPRGEAAKMACNSALADAIRNLTDNLMMVQFEPGRMTSEYGDSFKFKLSGMLQSLKPKSKSPAGDGSCTVTLEYPLVGKNSYASFILKTKGNH